jgi:ATPase subunit of ABC transporter with duplicated ATPase domains
LLRYCVDNFSGDSTKLKLKAGTLELQKGSHCHIYGPNGIGKTTLLESIVNGNADGIYINPSATIGYYRQDFNNLDVDKTVVQCLEKASAGKHSEQDLRMIAASLLLRGEVVKQKIYTLSEGRSVGRSFTHVVSLLCLLMCATCDVQDKRHWFR